MRDVVCLTRCAYCACGQRKRESHTFHASNIAAQYYSQEAQSRIMSVQRIPHTLAICTCSLCVIPCLYACVHTNKLATRASKCPHLMVASSAPGLTPRTFWHSSRVSFMLAESASPPTLLPHVPCREHGFSYGRSSCTLTTLAKTISHLHCFLMFSCREQESSYGRPSCTRHLQRLSITAHYSTGACISRALVPTTARDGRGRFVHTHTHTSAWDCHVCGNIFFI